MFDKLKGVESRFEELNSLLSDPAIISDSSTYTKHLKKRAELEPIVEAYRKWKKVSQDLSDNKSILEESKDADLRELAQAELGDLEESKEALEKELFILLLPKDPNDSKNIILELRAGAGGDESALFAEDLFSMYSRYAEKRRWKVELLSASYASVGGYKELVCRIEGSGAYSAFKYERGVHRVQRVPQTETQGRVHTSTVTVAVLPEAEEVDIQINEKDLRIDVFRASGPGGQSVNTTDSAVRITHLPTGVVVSCQDEKSQHKNKAKAMTVLRSRLLEAKEAEAAAERRDDRRSQVGTGERSEKIRTYNFPQGRVTDHRISHTIYQLETFLSGELNLMVEPLRMHEQSEAMKKENQE